MVITTSNEFSWHDKKITVMATVNKDGQVIRIVPNHAFGPNPTMSIEEAGELIITLATAISWVRKRA